MNKAFVFYRFPHASEYTVMRQLTGTPTALCSYEQIGEMPGFIFAPFNITSHCPLLLLRPDIIEKHEVNFETDFDTCIFATRDIENERNKYGRVFRRFHEMLTKGSFQKIVLSRVSIEQTETDIDSVKLFQRACCLYPRMFIALVSMPQCGTWLMATPEILVESNGQRWHTMAVAGTMHIDTVNDTDEHLAARKLASDISEWNEKNKQEQAYVSEYILSRLQHMGTDIQVTGPYTLRAGIVKHLTTDFNFNLAPEFTIGQLINTLHPTPAVCGIPKDRTYKYILSNEEYDRKYYSGFTGVVNCDEGTHLYVTLRCMQIEGPEYKLYGGGGLLADSEEHNEWLETETKMETIRKCLAIKRM